MLFLIIFFLDSCAIKKPSHFHSFTQITKNSKFITLKLNDLNKQITLKQRLKGRYKSNSYEINTIVDFSPTRLYIVGLSDFGTNLFSLNYTEEQKLSLNFSQNASSSVINPEYILTDLQLVYWPIEKIQNNITGPLIVYEKNKNKKYHRIFYEYEKTIIQISYSRKDIWHADIHYQNFEKNYEYFITNLK